MKRICALAVTILMGIVLGAGVAGAEVFETPKNRKAADILPADMVSGEHFTVRENVAVYDYLHAYTVDSDYGTFTAISDGGLRKLLLEIRAITELRKIADAEAFAKALGAAAAAPVKLGVSLVTNPVETVAAIPKGIGQLFSDAVSGFSTEKQAGEDGQVEEVLELSRFKREYAFNLGVDAYSSNEVFQAELNRVAWGGVAGNLGFSAATAPLGGIGYIVSGSAFGQQMNDYLAENPPSRIRSNAQEKLAAMGVGEKEIKAFLEAKGYTPRHTAVIVGHLERLGKASGIDSYINYASHADNEEEATFFMNIAEILGGYHQKVSPIRQVGVAKAIVWARDENGTILAPFPLDYGVWTEQVSVLVREMIAENTRENEKQKFELWVTGTMSPLAKKNLEARGVTVNEEVYKRIDLVDYVTFKSKPVSPNPEKH